MSLLRLNHGSSKLEPGEQTFLVPCVKLSSSTYSYWWAAFHHGVVLPEDIVSVSSQVNHRNEIQWQMRNRPVTQQLTLNSGGAVVATAKVRINQKHQKIFQRLGQKFLHIFCGVCFTAVAFSVCDTGLSLSASWKCGTSWGCTGSKDQGGRPGCTAM